MSIEETLPIKHESGPVKFSRTFRVGNNPENAVQRIGAEVAKWVDQFLSKHKYARQEGALDPSYCIAGLARNAVEHGKADSVSVDIIIEAGILTAHITDEGKGILPASVIEIKSGHTLAFVIEHATEFYIESSGKKFMKHGNFLLPKEDSSVSRGAKATFIKQL